VHLQLSQDARIVQRAGELVWLKKGHIFAFVTFIYVEMHMAAYARSHQVALWRKIFSTDSELHTTTLNASTWCGLQL